MSGLVGKMSGRSAKCMRGWLNACAVGKNVWAVGKVPTPVGKVPVRSAKCILGRQCACAVGNVPGLVG